MRRLPLRSPPRVRGKEWYLQGESPAPGITPACAGKRTAQRSQRCQKWDHPRVCGEKTLCRSTVVPVWGSPPRMRGKGEGCSLPGSCRGITPACAGKSVKVNEPDCLPRDHPRVCGEKNGICRAKVPHLGSPPRMRGKGVVHVFVPEKFGITPAYAGKRFLPLRP